MSDGGALPNGLGRALRELSTTLRLRNRLFALLSVVLVAIGAITMYVALRGPAMTTHEIVCVSIKLAGGVNGPNGARVRRELHAANIPVDYCTGFRVPK